MVPSLRPSVAAVGALALLASAASGVKADCASEITAISHGACVGIRQPFFGAANTVAAYAEGGVTCPAVQADVAALVGADALTDECCTSLRAFVSAGCACDGDVQALLDGLHILPAGADTATTIAGVVALIQGSRCTGAALGGPMLDACTGSVGCPVGGGGVTA